MPFSIRTIAAIILITAALCLPTTAEQILIDPVKPEIKIRTDKDSQWEPAEKKINVKPGAQISTNAGGEAVLTWFNGYAVRLRPMSVLEITSASALGETHQTELKLNKGSLMARVPKLKSKDSSFTVITATAVTGVRGTAFEITIAEDDTTIVTAIEDAVYVIAEQIEVVLDPGFSTIVLPNEPPTQPNPIPKAQFDSLKQQIEQIEPEEQGTAPESNEADTAVEEANRESDTAAEEAAEAAAEEAQENVQDIIEETINESIETIEDHFPY